MTARGIHIVFCNGGVLKFNAGCDAMPARLFYFLSSKSGVNFHKWGRVSLYITDLADKPASNTKQKSQGGGGGVWAPPPPYMPNDSTSPYKPFQWPQSLVLITAIYTLLGLTWRPCMVRGLILFLIRRLQTIYIHTNHTFTQHTHTHNHTHT